MVTIRYWVTIYVVFFLPNMCENGGDKDDIIQYSEK